MPRTPRMESSTRFYHVLARGHNRKAIFLDDQDHQNYLTIFARFKKQFPCLCHHFCLMPNHIHLLLEAQRRELLTALMRRVQQRYQYHWRRRYGLVGYLWQGRFKSIPIEKESYLLECARYIERNPVRAGLCVLPEEYPWSSASFYLVGRQKGLEFLDRNPAYETLGPTESLRQHYYRQYIHQERPYEKLVDLQIQQMA